MNQKIESDIELQEVEYTNLQDHLIPEGQYNQSDFESRPPWKLNNIYIMYFKQY